MFIKGGNVGVVARSLVRPLSHFYRASDPIRRYVVIEGRRGEEAKEKGCSDDKMT